MNAFRECEISRACRIVTGRRIVLVLVIVIVQEIYTTSRDALHVASMPCEVY